MTPPAQPSPSPEQVAALIDRHAAFQWPNVERDFRAAAALIRAQAERIAVLDSQLTALEYGIKADRYYRSHRPGELPPTRP